MPEKTTTSTEDTLDQLKYQLECDKLAFEKGKEKDRFELEKKKLRQSGRDTFVRGFASVLITVLVTGGLTLYGRSYEERRADEVADTRKAEMTIQLINAREKANNELRASMFKTLIDFYQNDPNGMSGVLLLELVGLNFRDTVLLKPVFENLDQDPELSDKQRKALRKASRTIVKDQLEAIRQSRDGEVCKLKLKTDETDSAWCFPPLVVTLIKTDDNQVTIRTNSKEGFIRDGEDTQDGDEFDVNYFDMPMIDYTVSSTGYEEIWRYSIVLDESSQEEATIVIAVLPQDSYSAQMPFRFDEMMSDYINPPVKDE